MAKQKPIHSLFDSVKYKLESVVSNVVLTVLCNLFFSPVKADFIRAKYQFLSFLNKNKDTDITSIDDISQVCGIPIKLSIVIIGQLYTSRSVCGSKHSDQGLNRLLFGCR